MELIIELREVGQVLDMGRIKRINDVNLKSQSLQGFSREQAMLPKLDLEMIEQLKEIDREVEDMLQPVQSEEFYHPLVGSYFKCSASPIVYLITDVIDGECFYQYNKYEGMTLQYQGDDIDLIEYLSCDIDVIEKLFDMDVAYFSELEDEEDDIYEGEDMNEDKFSEEEALQEDSIIAGETFAEFWKTFINELIEKEEEEIQLLQCEAQQKEEEAKTQAKAIELTRLIIKKGFCNACEESADISKLLIMKRMEELIEESVALVEEYESLENKMIKLRESL